MLGGEMCLLYIAATEGMVYHADYQVSEYRIHAGGVHNSQSKIKQQEDLIQHLKIIKKYFNVSWLEYHKKRSYMMSDLNKVTGKYTTTLAAYRLFFLVCESLPAFFVRVKRFFSPRRIIGIMMPSAVKQKANLFFGDFDKGGYLFKRIAVFYQVKVRKRRLALMSILSLSDHKKVMELESGSEFEAVGPKTVKSGPVRAITMIPPLGLHQFNDAVVNAKSNCIASDNHLYCESYNSNEQFNQGLVEWHDEDDAIIKTLPEERLDDGFFLAGLGSFNWYHWLVEILPKVMHLSVVPTKNILVSDFVASCPSMLDSLKSIIGDEYKLIFMKGYKNYRLKNLYHINAVSYVPFELKAEHQFKVEDVFMREGLLMDMKEKIMAASKSHLETSTKKRIFIERTHHRLPSNQGELAAALATLGFESVSVEELTLNEQIDLFHNAECIVGASGAAFTNMMFAGENLKVICFMPRNLRDFSCFSNLAKIFSVDLTYSFYDLDENEHHYSNEFEIDIAEALNTVNAVLAH
jgi:capsular polysaccharide biosynthesis protein